jgi:tRNA (cmo5U34)-methyltransferase
MSPRRACGGTTLPAVRKADHGSAGVTAAVPGRAALANRPRAGRTHAGRAYDLAMPDSAESNAAVWKSTTAVAEWVATSDDRERRRAWPRRLMAELLPFTSDEQFTFVDLGAGTGAAARAVLDRYPGSTAVLADYSSQMMEEGRRSLAAYEGRYRYVEMDLASGRWPTQIGGGLEAVISSLCVHHLPDHRKQGLFDEIFERLGPGGWYLNYDPVRADAPATAAVWERVIDAMDPEAAAKRVHRTPDEQARWENHVRHIVPLHPQLEFLRTAGFEAVDVYWKELDHAIFGGRRPTR